MQILMKLLSICRIYVPNSIPASIRGIVVSNIVIHDTYISRLNSKNKITTITVDRSFRLEMSFVDHPSFKWVDKIELMQKYPKFR